MKKIWSRVFDALEFFPDALEFFLAFNDTLFIKIGQGIQMLRLIKDRKLFFPLLFFECFFLYLRKSSATLSLFRCATLHVVLWQPYDHRNTLQ